MPSDAQKRTLKLLNSFLDRQFKKTEQKVSEETFERYTKNIAEKIGMDPERERYFSVLHYLGFIKNYWLQKELISLSPYALTRLEKLKEGIEKRVNC